MPDLDVMGIVKKWLTDNGYGGLFNSDEPCGCELDDLFPCLVPPRELCCEPGYKCDCRADCASDQCDEYRRGEPGVWCIRRDKEWQQ